MYFEERAIAGILCYRTDPNKPFEQYTKAQLTEKVADLNMKIAAIAEVIAR